MSYDPMKFNVVHRPNGNGGEEVVAIVRSPAEIHTNHQMSGWLTLTELLQSVYPTYDGFRDHFKQADTNINPEYSLNGNANAKVQTVNEVVQDLIEQVNLMKSGMI